MRQLKEIMGALAAFLIATSVSAQPAERQGDTLQVATKIAEPFVMQTDSGDFEGISVELWNVIAADLGIQFEYVLTTLDDMLAGVEDGRFDAAIAAISVTPEREERIDLSHGYYTSGLGIAVPLRAGNEWVSVLSNIFTKAFLTAVGALVLLLLVIGLLIWLVERKRNKEHFGGGVAHGIGSGFWFSAVTMTTVGYGDKAPQTLPGRLLALVWMFGSIIIISAFTGAIASSLTTAQIVSGVQSVDDLRTARVGAMEGSASIPALLDRSIRARTYASVEDGMRALEEGQLDAFVHDRPILQYIVSHRHMGELHVLDAQFDLSAYAIALPPDAALKENINRQILEITRSPAWDQTLRSYLGE